MNSPISSLHYATNVNIGQYFFKLRFYVRYDSCNTPPLPLQVCDIQGLNSMGVCLNWVLWIVKEIIIRGWCLKSVSGHRGLRPGGRNLSEMWLTCGSFALRLYPHYYQIGERKSPKCCAICQYPQMNSTYIMVNF